MDATQFKAALSRWASGVVVVTLCGRQGRLRGVTVSSFSSLSLQPPLVLFCLGQGANIHPEFQQASHFAVNILSDSQQALSNRFAFGKDADPFAGVAHRPGPEGLPLLDGCLANIVCRKTVVHPAGDHDIIVGEVLEAQVGQGDPLLYYQGQYQGVRKLG